MVANKTNHELATELGFSVATVLHEIMHVYQVLNVSDRKEALVLGLARELFFLITAWALWFYRRYLFN